MSAPHRLLVAGVVVASLAGKGAPAVLDLRDWIGVCDNTLTCTVLGLPADKAGRAYLSLSRSGEPLSAPVLRVGIYDEGETQGAMVRLRAHGFEADLPARPENEQLVAETRDPGIVAALVRVLGEDQKSLDLTAGKTQASVAVQGGEAALAWMDERQERSGSVSALVRRGPRSPASIPAPPPEPSVYPAPEGSAAEIRPALFPKAIFGRPELKACAPEALSDLEGRAEWRLGPDLMLWEVPCTLNGYNQWSVFLISDEKGRDLRPAPIPRVPPQAPEPGPGDPAQSLANADFDPKTMMLSAFDKGGPQGDCGVLARFAWTGKVFAAAEVDYMPACRGLAPETWPTLVRARVR